MKADPILSRIHACITAGVPALMWGPPGSGKTARALSYGMGVSKHVERWLLSRCEPIDLRPRVYHEGRIIVSDPPEIERLTSSGGILFLDELNRATREVEGAALSIIDAPPKGVAILAACNPPSPGQAARNLESAAANRFCHLTVDADPEGWANAMVSGWGTAAGLPAYTPDPHDDSIVCSLVSAFIRRRPELLEKEPSNSVQAGKAWPSTRTWDMARRLLTVARGMRLDAEDMQALLGGCVGHGPATEFLAYVAETDLPDPEELLSLRSYKPPKGRVDKAIAAVTAVASAVIRNCTEDRWRAAWLIAGQCADAEALAAAMVLSELLIAHNRGLQGKPEQRALTAPSKLMHPRVSAAASGV